MAGHSGQFTPWRLPVNTVIHTTLAGIEPTTFRLLVRRATSSATESATTTTGNAHDRHRTNRHQTHLHNAIRRQFKLFSPLENDCTRGRAICLRQQLACSCLSSNWVCSLSACLSHLPSVRPLDTDIVAKMAKDMIKQTVFTACDNHYSTVFIANSDGFTFNRMYI